MAYVPIYPQFNIGDKVKAESYMIASRQQGHLFNYDMTVTSKVVEIILRKSILDNSFIYLYRLEDDDKIYGEYDMTLIERG